MTLRLRLTLFYTLLVALVLAASGLGLYLLLARSLHRSLDASLREAADLLNALVQNEDGTPSLKPEHEETTLKLPADLVAMIIDSAGRKVDQLGRSPSGPVVSPLGFSNWEDWRIYAQPISGGRLLTLRRRDGVMESLRRFTKSFLFLAPVAVALAFLLGYSLAGRALAPVGKLTSAAHDLASRHAWRERLPEPERQDELWRLAQGTNSLLAALEQVIESERRFTADAAHELRTPLTALRGRLEKALEEAPDKRTATALGKALEASDDIFGLVEKLLMLARAEAGQGLTPERLAVDEVAFENAESLRPLFYAKGLALELELPEAPAWVKGDRIALGLAVHNLLENALKFTSQGKVIVRVEGSRTVVTLTVEDEGLGIPEGALSRLFDRFFQVDVRHRRTGSGLGLALVKTIATWHGGTVRAENRLEGGARFTFEIPASYI